MAVSWVDWRGYRIKIEFFFLVSLRYEFYFFLMGRWGDPSMTEV